MGVLYATNGKIYCNDYFEVYVPLTYFTNDEDGPIFAVNKGTTLETLGVLYCRTFKDGNENPVQFFNVPTVIDLMIYETKQDMIKVNGLNLEVLTLQYMKDQYVFHQTLPKGREVANAFLDMVLAGKLPRTLNYDQILDIWWRNLEISGISYKVPSKIFEMIIASIYRDPDNPKRRYGQHYGKSASATGYDYKTDNVRNVVKQLSTFSGMVFEDIGTMITNGINNSTAGIEEPVSPLEKIIHY